MNANALRLLLKQQGIDESALMNMPMSGRMTDAGEELSIGGALPEKRNALAQMMQSPELLTYEQFKEQGPAPGEGYMETSDGRRITFGRKVADAPMQAPQRQSSEGEQINFSRPGFNINGRKGFYGKDGMTGFIPNQDGGYDKVQFDTRTPQEINAANMAQLDMEARRAQIDSTRENILRSQTERTRREVPQEKWTTDAARGVQINERTGEARPITMDGKPLAPKEAMKPLNENQGKAMSFGARMAEAHNILDEVGQDGKVQPSLLRRTADNVPLIGGALAMGANAAASPEQQQVEQAQRNFINAVLRRESGAVISEAEFANAAQQYFPQPNDDAKNIAQKKRARETAIENMAYEAGPGADRIREKLRVQSRQMPAPKSEQDYKALPSGTRFLDPNGVERIKP